MSIRLLFCAIVLVAGVCFVTGAEAAAGESGAAKAGETPPLQDAESKAGGGGWAERLVGSPGGNGMNYLKRGGVLMYPLAGLCGASVLLILYYALTVRKQAVVSQRFVDAASALIRRRDYPGLVAICHGEREAMARVVRVMADFLVRNPAAGLDEIREVTGCEGSRQANLMLHRLRYLADAGTIAPLIGLLGTIIGLIKTFRTLHPGALVPPELMRAGVAEALITTAAGLLIGIPSLLCYSLFRKRTRGMIREMEAAMARFLSLVGGHRERLAATGVPAEKRAAAAVEEGSNLE